MLGADDLNEVLTGVQSGDPAARDRAADVVADVVRALSGDQADQLARTLVTAASQEVVDDCRGSELNASRNGSTWTA